MGGGEGTMAVTDKEHLDYSSTVPVETSMRNGMHQVISPIGGVANQNGPFTFVIDSQPEWNYVMLSRARLEMKAKILKGDNSELGYLSNVVAPVNLLGACMWDKVDVEINNHTFTPSSAVMAGKKHYIENVLTDNTSSKENQLHTQMFYPDTPGFMGVFHISRLTAKKAFIAAVRRGEDGCAVTFGEDILSQDDPDSSRVKVDNWLGLENPRCPGTYYPNTVDNYDSRESARLIRRWKAVEAAFNEYVSSPDRNLMDRISTYHYNRGFDKRFEAVMGSKVFDTYSPIPHDAFQMDNHVGPKNRIVIRLSRAPDSFILNTYDNDVHYKLQILDLKLHFDTVELKSSIPMPLRERYLMNETQMHKHLVAAHSPSTHIRLQDSGVLPKMVIVCMTSTQAADGNYLWNPWNYFHFHLESIYLTVNGVRMPQDTLKMNFSADPPLASHAYAWLFENTGATQENKGNQVTPAGFNDGYFFVPFDLNPDKCAMEHMHDALDGSLTLDLNFGKHLDTAIYVHYELVYPKRVTNFKANNVFNIEDVQQ